MCPLKSSYEEAIKILVSSQPLDFMLKGTDSNAVMSLINGYWNLHWALREVAHDVAMVVSKILMLLNKEFTIREDLRYAMSAEERNELEARKAY